MSDQKLAKNLWQSTADDKLANDDVYKSKGDGVVNSVKSLTDIVDVDLVSALRGGRSMAAALPAVTKLVGKGKVAFDQKTLLERVVASSSAVASTMKSLSSNKVLQGDILKQVKDTNSLIAKVGNLSTRIKSTDFSKMASVGQLLNAYTQNNELFKYDDIDGQVGLVAGIVNECTKQKVPGSLKELTKTITRTDVLKRVFDRCLDNVCQSGDATSLAYVGERMGNKSTYQLNPTILDDFGKQYTKPEQCTMEDQDRIYNEVMNAYSSVDTDWYKGVRNTDAGIEPVISLQSLTVASDDFKDVVASGAKLKPVGTDENLLLLGTQLKATSVDKELKKSFPYTVVNSNTVSNTVVSPLNLT